MNKEYYNIRNIKWYEKFLLLFKKKVYICDKNGNVINNNVYKHLFGKSFDINNNKVLWKGK